MKDSASRNLLALSFLIFLNKIDVAGAIPWV